LDTLYRFGKSTDRKETMLAVQSGTVFLQSGKQPHSKTWGGSSSWCHGDSGKEDPPISGMEEA
jgi:hypothetical protein